MRRKFWKENLNVIDHLEQVVVDRMTMTTTTTTTTMMMMMIKWILKETFCEGVNWTKVAQDRVQCRELVNTVIKFRVP